MNDRSPGQEPQPARQKEKEPVAANNREQSANAKEEGPSLADQAKALFQNMKQGLDRGMEAIDQFWGQDARAWFRQGLHELQEATVAFPGNTPVAQPMPYGGIGQPPPSTVARAMADQEPSATSLYGQDQKQTYSIEQLKDRGQDILRSQENDRQRDRGLDHGR